MSEWDFETLAEVTCRLEGYEKCLLLKARLPKDVPDQMARDLRFLTDLVYQLLASNGIAIERPKCECRVCKQRMMFADLERRNPYARPEPVDKEPPDPADLEAPDDPDEVPW